MCHTNLLDDSLQFTTYQKFIVQEELLNSLIFDTGMMPAARLTMDRFWSPFFGGASAGHVLAEHLARRSDADPLQAPGAAAAAITGLSPAPNRSDTVYVDGRQSIFADSYSWRLAAPAGSAAQLVGEATQHPMFVVDVPGTYELNLTVNAGSDNEATAASVLEATNRGPTAMNDLFGLSLVESTVLPGSVITADPNQDFDPDGDPLAAAIAAGGLPEHGNLVLNADGTFTYTYTGLGRIRLQPQ